MSEWVAINSGTVQLSGSPQLIKVGDVIDDGQVDVSILRAAGIQLVPNTGGAAAKQAFQAAQVLRGNQPQDQGLPFQGVYLRMGQATVANTDTTAVWTFDGAEPDANYYVMAIPTAIGSTANAGASRVRSVAKFTGNVTLTVEDAPSAGKSVTFDIFIGRT